jgi:hypothetical protein
MNIDKVIIVRPRDIDGPDIGRIHGWRQGVIVRQVSKALRRIDMSRDLIWRQGIPNLDGCNPLRLFIIRERAPFPPNRGIETLGRSLGKTEKQRY